ncbi:hypothetical protein [Bradyrhizobium diazoefficiens]|uniref:hypothetical protein n=1 Tax=Bradyrhizobium diazoefficiens TaxID=1355477 RepID=UPI0034933DA8
MPFRVLPVILTCGSQVAVTRKFAASLVNVLHALKPAVVLVDMSASPCLSADYLAVISSIAPTAIYVHQRKDGVSIYDSVQDAANTALRFALQHSQEDDYILFMEDDIVFSSLFPEKATNTYLGPEAGFLTLYMPDNGYGFHIIKPSEFYGTQCLLFTRKAVEEIVRGCDEMMANLPPGYDIRWSRFLAQKGYVLYCPDKSYVQHQSGLSRLHHQVSHVSNCFRP